MPDFCVGTAQFGMEYGIANATGKPTKVELLEIIKHATDNNITYFDTAQSYDKCEILLGECYSKLDIENIKIITKLHPSLGDCKKNLIYNSIKSSLYDLKQNSLYGFIAHNIESLGNDSFSASIMKAKSEGLVNKCGVSIYTPEEAKTALRNPIVDILQIPLNIFDRRWFDQGIIELASSKNVRLFFRSIFLQGFIFMEEDNLIGKGMRWSLPYYQKIKNILRNVDEDPIQLTFNLLSEISSDSVIIFGVDNIIQLKKAIKCIKRTKLFTKHSSNNQWWGNLPHFPEKFFNPSKW